MKVGEKESGELANESPGLKIDWKQVAVSEKYLLTKGRRYDHQRESDRFFRIRAPYAVVSQQQCIYERAMCGFIKRVCPKETLL